MEPQLHLLYFLLTKQGYHNSVVIKVHGQFTSQLETYRKMCTTRLAPMQQS